MFIVYYDTPLWDSNGENVRSLFLIYYDGDDVMLGELLAWTGLLL